MFLKKVYYFIPFLLITLLIAGMLPIPLPRAEASISFVQTNNGVTDGGTSVSVTFPSAAVTGNLMVAICAARNSSTLSISSPSGFQTAINQTGTPSQGIFYKIATGGETSITCSSTANTRLGLHIYEYSGIDQDSPFDNAGSASGTGSDPSSGSVSTSLADTVLIAGIVINANTTIGTWTNSFNERNNFINGGAAGSRSRYGGADLIVSSTGTYSTSVTAGASAAWRGQIAAFRQAPPPTFTLTVNVTGQGSVVKNPDKQDYDENESVELTATPASGWQFVNWSGDLSGSTNPETIIMNSNKTVTAVFEEIPVTFSQKNFRIYQNTNAVNPAVPLADENASAPGIQQNEVIRLRISAQTAGNDLPTNTQSFTLQYAAKGGAENCIDVPGVNFAQVGGIGSSAIWRGFSNGEVSDGDIITSLLLAGSTVEQSYEESNDSVPNPNAITLGGVGEWDWVVQNNGATSNRSYCFRMVKQGGEALSYERMPEVKVIRGFTQLHYRWRNDDGGE